MRLRLFYLKMLAAFGLTLIGLSFQIDQSKPKVEVYQGGREGYSRITLELKPNGKYRFEEWVHSGKYHQDKGRYFVEDTIITLNSSRATRPRYTGNPMGIGLQKIKRFVSAKYRIKSDKIYLYHDDQIEAKTGYAELYFTLYRVID